MYCFCLKKTFKTSWEKEKIANYEQSSHLYLNNNTLFSSADFYPACLKWNL